MIDLYDKPLVSIDDKAFIDIRDEIKDNFIIDCATALSLKKITKIDILENFLKAKIGDKLHLALIRYYLVCKNDEYNEKIHKKYNLLQGELSKNEISYITRIPLNKLKTVGEYRFLKSQNRNVLLCQLGIIARSINYSSYWNVFCKTRDKEKRNNFLSVKIEFNP